MSGRPLTMAAVAEGIGPRVILRAKIISWNGAVFQRHRMALVTGLDILLSLRTMEGEPAYSDMGLGLDPLGMTGLTACGSSVFLVALNAVLHLQLGKILGGRAGYISGANRRVPLSVIGHGRKPFFLDTPVHHPDQNILRQMSF